MAGILRDPRPIGPQTKGVNLIYNNDRLHWLSTYSLSGAVLSMFMDSST